MSTFTRSRSPAAGARRCRGSTAASSSAGARAPVAAATAPSGLLTLPDDILAAICAAAGQDELPALRLTCTGLLGPANAAARRLCLRRACRLQRGLSTFYGAKEVVIEDWTDGWLEELVQVSCQQWTHALRQLVPARPCATLAPRHTSVTQPCAIGNLRYLCLQALPGVESLRLGRLQPVTAAAVAALARLPRLCRLDCTGGGLTEGAVAALAALPPPLTSLSLRECSSLSDASLAALLAGLPGLREADLSLCSQLGDGTLAQLGRCSQLAKLDLTGCERFRWGEGTPAQAAKRLGGHGTPLLALW